MNMLFRNFFYAVGFTALFFLYQADPNTIALGDFVRLVQSIRAQQLVLVITAALIALEFTLSGSRRVGGSSSSSNGSAATVVTEAQP
jgi:hypothetical protein